jgi:hypothetical protein
MVPLGGTAGGGSLSVGLLLQFGNHASTKHNKPISHLSFTVRLMSLLLLILKLKVLFKIRLNLKGFCRNARMSREIFEIAASKSKLDFKPTLL